MPAVAAKKEERADVAKPYVMPKPMGGVVVWNQYERGRRAIVNDCMGMVTRVGDRSVDLVIFTAGGTVRVLFGVRYCNDPDLGKASVPSPDGVWDFTPLELQVRELTADSRI